ncbi:MAG: PEP-CTERM sorting domain-containing protein [Caldilineaceae bacterium]
MAGKQRFHRSPFWRQLALFRVVVVLLGALLLFFGSSPTTVFACTPPVGGHRATVSPIEPRADLVIVGTVVAFTDDSFMGTSTIQVDSYMKGNGLKQLVVTNLGTSALCLQAPPREGTYLFFAYGDADSGEVSAQYFSAFGAYVPATAANIAEATVAISGGPTPGVTPVATPSAPPVTVPEPISLVLLGTGVSSLAGYVIHQRRRKHWAR